MHRHVHRRDAVLGEQQHRHLATVEELDQLADHGIDGGDILRDGRVGRPETLEVVIQVRQINQAQRGPMLELRPPGRLGDPAGGGVRRALRRGQPGGRSPKGGKRKLAELLFDLRPQPQRRGVNVENLASIGRIQRTRRDRPIRAGIHVVPPKKLGTGETRNEGDEVPPKPSGRARGGWIASRIAPRPVPDCTSHWRRCHARWATGR